MPLRQRLDSLIEPTDVAWRSATKVERKAFYSKAGDVALDRMKIQLSRGIGANGRAMKPRIQAVLPDGADGPVLEPHYNASRVISLSDYMATDKSLTIFWHAGTGHKSHRAYRAAKKAKKRAGRNPPKFGEILQFHADGLVRGAPKRDVRLSRASINQIRLVMRTWWAERTRAATRQAARTKPKPTPQPRPEPTPTPQPRRRIAARPSHPTPTHPIPVVHAVPKGRVKGPTFVVSGAKDQAKYPTFKGVSRPR